MNKALLLFSGGLDSILAYYILKNAGIDEIKAIFYETPFFPSDKPRLYAEKNNIKLIVKKIFTDYRKMLLNPRYGYGKHLNPCIDCHTLMINKTMEIAKTENIEIVATGEVIGQRPMSQNRGAFNAMNKMITDPQMILRPLCALLSEETDMEKKGIVNREKLLGLNGRSRKKQIELAKRMKIMDYPNPAGGCLLTHKEYSDKVKLLVEREMLNSRNVELIKYGRVCFLKKGFTVIARDDKCNEKLMKIAKENRYHIMHEKGPIGIICGKIEEDEYNMFIQKMKKHSKNMGKDNEIIQL